MDEPQIARLATWKSIGIRRTAAAVIATAAVLTALATLPGRFAAVNAQVSSLAALTPTERVLRGARGSDVDTGLFLLARTLIPSGAPYYVATGPRVGVSTPVTYAAASGLAQLYMLPRIQVADPRLAFYVVSYGGDPGALGIRIAKIWRYKPGLEVAEIAR